MSLVTTAGLWSNDDDNIIIEQKKNTRRTPQNDNQPQKTFGDANTQFSDASGVKTIKNAILDKIANINIKNDGDNLMKFTPITPPLLQANKKEDVISSTPAQPITTPKLQYGSQNLGDSYSNYKTSYVPPTLIPPLTHSEHEGYTNKKGGDNLMEKINYAIHLLEKQQSQKTEHIIEEFILYGFAGVFVIFLVDSFNRTAKYTR
jgi:hypothetical protein